MDPLAQLADIETPAQIGQWPIAIGWWLLLAMLIVLSVVIVKKINQALAKKCIQKQAIKKLATNTLSISEITQVVKWAAMHYFPRHEIANLSGEKLAAYLAGKLPKNKQQSFVDNCLPAWQQQYQISQSDDVKHTFQQASVLWLKHALPPRTNQDGDKK